MDTFTQLIDRGGRWSFAAPPLLTLTLSLMVLMPCRADAATSLPDTTRQTQLISLVRQDCGSCHGLTLKGGLGPALLPQTLQGQSVAALKSVILYGRPGTAMPPWQRFLTEAEAEWIVVNLQKGFPR